MKILKPGKTPDPKPAHAGKTAECAKCGAKVELEAGDKVVRISRAKVDGGAKFKCPTRACDGELSIKK